jgi:hypothetical protein
VSPGGELCDGIEFAGWWLGGQGINILAYLAHGDGGSGCSKSFDL